jgi:radical SAM protein with 4Fe4S-binding SPASM domain
VEGKPDATPLHAPAAVFAGGDEMPDLRVLCLEVTKKCNMSPPCRYCSAYSIKEEGEKLSLDEEKALLDHVSSFAKPIVLFTGGEPLMREDIFELAEYAHQKGMPVGLPTNGILLTKREAELMKEVGIYRACIDLDGASPEIHNSLRGEFELALKGIQICKQEGLSLQVNSVITRLNKDEMPALLELLQKLRVDAWHVFFLVPTKGFEEDYMLSPEEYEEALKWLSQNRKGAGMEVAATCAPQYLRFFGEVSRGEWKVARGCSAGIGFVFISHLGNVYPCDHLPLSAGNIRERDFEDIWSNAAIFKELRDFNKLKGKCGICEYKNICGGCRARAYFHYGDYLEEDPGCIYVPQHAA